MIKKHLCSPWGLFALAFLYSIYRYGIYRSLPVENWPAFMLNKALAFAAVSCLAIGSVRLLRRKPATAHINATLLFGLAHAMISMAIFHPEYFAYLFQEDGGRRMNVYGEIAIAFGSIAAAVLLRFALQRGGHPRWGNTVLIAVLMMHVLGVGLPKWATYFETAGSAIPASLFAVPISLLSMTVLLIGFIRCLRLLLTDTDKDGIAP